MKTPGSDSVNCQPLCSSSDMNGEVALGGNKMVLGLNAVGIVGLNAWTHLYHVRRGKRASNLDNEWSGTIQLFPFIYLANPV